MKKKVAVLQYLDSEDHPEYYEIVMDGNVLKKYDDLRRVPGFIDALKVIYGEDNLECELEYD
jgi:hypothetical protein